MLKNLFTILCLSLLIASCASLDGLEEGRTLGKGHNEIGVSGSYTTIPDLTDEADVNIGYPTITASYKHGVAENIDVSGTISTVGYIGAGVKYQFLGDQEAKFNMAAGLNLGSSIGVIHQLAIPLYMSYHPTEKLAINFSPKYFVLFTSVDGASNNGSFLGGNFGLLFGDRHKFGIDIGLFSPIADGVSDTGILNIALGGKFTLSK